MATLRTLVGTATLTLALASSCNKKTDEGTNAPVTAPVAEPTQHDDAPSNSVVGEPVPAAEKINIVASIDNLEDMFEAFKQLGESFDPDSPSDPLATLQSQLLAFGFGPGFLGNIDLGGTHVLVGSFPAQGQGGPSDSDFAASIAVKSGRKVLESTPSAFRPQPLGEGMWEFSQDSLRMLIKEAGKELQLGMTVTDLDRAAQLQGELGNGRRVRLRATNIPADDIDPVGLLDLPDIKIVRDLTKVVQEVEALEIQSQIGTKTDFEFIASAEAPFHKLGLGPLGKPQTSSSRVEKVLPAGPVFVTSLAYGNPKTLHKMIDASVPMGMIPDPFKAMAEQTLGSVHGILDQIGTGVVFALYVDAKGRGTIVAAADVKNEAAATKSLRSLNEVMVMAVEMQKTIGGKDKTRAFDASFKRESVKLA
ncbi:MAG: hypothetical protein JKY37_30235, partial [Nannocystaceae bacterium]|nr:hypothetical protein [Nannocystaceae bacterium]